VSRLVAAIAVLTCAAFLACGGDDDGGPQNTLGDITPVGTKDATATPEGGSNGAEAPTPVPPPLDEELTIYLAGSVQSDILPGDSYEIDPVAIAEQVGTPPSCDHFQFNFAWQVTDPYPPEGVSFKWQIQRDTGPVDIATGPAGTQTTGCDVLTAVNESDIPIFLNVAYLIGGRD
jgi:hypothetical protein